MLVNMGRVFRQTALRYGGLPAVINVERGRSYSYLQMHEITNRLANALSARFGLSDGDFYATILDNDNMALFHPWMLKSPVGAAWIDARESVSEQLAQVDQAGPRVVFLEARFLEALHQALAERGIQVVSLDPPPADAAGVHDFWRLVEEASPAEVADEFVADDSRRHVSLLRFTGGTTGRAKCAMYSLANLWTWGCNPLHYYETIPYDHPRALFFSPLNHAASGSVVIPVHLKGGAVVTLNRAEIELLGRTIQDQAANMIYAVPTVLYRMLDMDLPSRYDLTSLKTIRYGAAPISPAKLEALLEVFGPVFVQGYGSTECWPSVTALGRDDHRTDSEEGLRRLRSVGRPLPGEEVMVCDELGNPLGPGSNGELWIRGANTVQGYFRDPEQTRENFTDNGFWRSGDIGYMDELGYVYLIDRKKDLIISGGYNVYATEVENCLNSHPAVQNSAVVGVPDEEWGEAVRAVVVLASGRRAQEAELIEHCKQRLARHKAPKAVAVVDELPVSPAGKVLRREVRRRLVEPD
jgi:acyl-CoA synthetase (AMP-forming)/AMP-acid ligase II